MGSGATVAKEAAQIVLLEDDFGAIVDGIREGRLIFENLKKCIAYVLSSNVPELVSYRQLSNLPAEIVTDPSFYCRRQNHSFSI